MERTIHKEAANLIADLPWGVHSCHFYETKKDLLDILLPYFKAGLSNNEFCLWITSKRAEVNEVKRAMGQILPKFDSYLERGQIEILPYTYPMVSQRRRVQLATSSHRMHRQMQSGVG